MGDLGFSWDGEGQSAGAGWSRPWIPSAQTAITEMRKSGLNIMMSMKQEGKPVSFVEDCAVELPDLAEYTAGLTRDLRPKHGTRGTWYAHASVGCLHVRPILNMKAPEGADNRCARSPKRRSTGAAQYKGSHSGEHGDGIVRSEFHEQMFGSRLVKAFEERQTELRSLGPVQPGQDHAARPGWTTGRCSAFRPAMAVEPFETELDWSQWPGEGGWFRRARPRCATTTAPAASSRAASCVRPTVRPATSAT